MKMSNIYPMDYCGINQIQKLSEEKNRKTEK